MKKISDPYGAKNQFYLFLFALIFFIPSFVSANSGVIETGFYKAQLCYEPTCSAVAPDILNWKPSNQSSADMVIVDDATGLSGWVWGNTLGWINLHPTGNGVTLDSQTGELSGKAWSSVSGWVNFNPTGPEGVVINGSTGEFSGYAWTGGPQGGWIKFDCKDVASCVKTTWRAPVKGGNGGGKLPLPGDENKGGGGGGGGEGNGGGTDMCPNIPYVQLAIPVNHSITIKGDCVERVDECPNISGDQALLPKGYEKTKIGSCIQKKDQCPNITGQQSTVPDGSIIDKKGNCFEIKKIVDLCPKTSGVQTLYSQCYGETDLCPNLIGLQDIIPENYLKSEGGNCFSVGTDICPNLEGNQLDTPKNMTIDGNGDCVEFSTDSCPNLPGEQERVPDNYTKKGVFCTLTVLSTGDDLVVAYRFIPKKLQIPVNEKFLKILVEKLNTKFDVGITEGQPYRVDAVSSAVTFVGSTVSVGGFLHAIRVGMRMMKEANPIIGASVSGT